MFEYEILITGAAVTIVLLYLWNQHQRMIHWFAFFILLNFAMIVLWQEMTNAWLYLPQGVVSIGLITTFAIRFRARQPKLLTDYLKWIGTGVLVSLPYLQLLPFDDVDPVLSVSSLVVFFIYVYDRWVTRPDPITGQFRTLLLVQSLAIVLILIYALVQRTQAIRLEELAKKIEMQALEIKTESEREKLELEKEVAELRMQLSK